MKNERANSDRINVFRVYDQRRLFGTFSQVRIEFVVFMEFYVRTPTTY